MFLKIKQCINSVQNCFAAKLFLRDMKNGPDEITMHILKISHIYFNIIKTTNDCVDKNLIVYFSLYSSFCFKVMQIPHLSFCCVMRGKIKFTFISIK
jgi:hypothetical protein